MKTIIKDGVLGFCVLAMVMYGSLYAIFLVWG